MTNIRILTGIAFMALAGIVQATGGLSGLPALDAFCCGFICAYALFSGRTRRKCIGCKMWKSEREMKDEHFCKKCAKVTKRTNIFTHGKQGRIPNGSPNGFFSTYHYHGH